MSTATSSRDYGPWNPGISSQLPRAYLSLSTMFREENVSTSLDEAHELSDFCGLAPHELVAFRAERLVVHELLVRVTANLSVSDGSNYGDLGINVREITSTILEKYLAPHRKEFICLLGDLKNQASRQIASELSKELFNRKKPETAAATDERRPLAWLFGFARPKTEHNSLSEAPEDRESRVVAEWQRKSDTAECPLDKSCYDSLIKIVSAITSKRGRLFGDQDLVTKLAVTMVCNDHGSDLIGAAIEPYFQQAVVSEGYRLLPRQDKPVVMNVKGASAAGKSTMRPLQRTLAERLNVPWHDFALISPDIWRKFLLDYDSLGAAYKYAGTMTSHEVEIIDKKLDRFMAKKAAVGAMSHLLIDRFRFDSFVPESDGDEASKLLTRFGNLVYMFFMITPPDATVERAWKRGLKFGRYKSVDDLLHHNVEAYTGMPQLFFTWALRTKKRVHYEFLDNSVPEGCRPRTIAFGWNGEMNILDISCLLDVDRFRKIDVNAKMPKDVYADERMVPSRNVEFLKRCARMIPVINFADHRSGQVYARLENGKWTWRDEAHFARALGDDAAKAGLEAIASSDCDCSDNALSSPPRLDRLQAHTLGAWGADDDDAADRKASRDKRTSSAVAPLPRP